MNSDEYQEEFAAASAARQWQLLTANDGFLLEKEFASLRKFEPQRAVIATHPHNKSKNRYGMIYSYDEDFCRVKLDKNLNERYRSDTDYINASKIYSVPPVSRFR